MRIEAVSENDVVQNHAAPRSRVVFAVVRQLTTLRVGLFHVDAHRLVDHVLAEWDSRDDWEATGARALGPIHEALEVLSTASVDLRVVFVGVDRDELFARPGVTELLAPRATQIGSLSPRRVVEWLGLRWGGGCPSDEDVLAAANQASEGKWVAHSFWEAWGAAAAMAGAHNLWKKWATPSSQTATPTDLHTTLQTTAGSDSHAGDILSKVERSPSAARSGRAVASPGHKDLMTIAQLALYLGKPRQWLYRNVRGNIPCVKPPGSRSVWYRRADVERLLMTWTGGTVEAMSVAPPLAEQRPATRDDGAAAAQRWRLRRNK